MGGVPPPHFFFWRFSFWRVLGGFLSRYCRVFDVCHVLLQSPPVFREQSREAPTRARTDFFSAKRFGPPRSWSRACLLYVVMSSFLASLLGRTLGGFGVALGAICLHFGAWRRPKGIKNQSSLMIAFWNAKKYGPSKF